MSRAMRVVFMDADLQDEPEVIPELLRHYQAGADVVYARRASREEGPLLRVGLQALLRIVSSLAEVPLPLDSGDFALLSAPVVAALRRLPERQRYHPRSARLGRLQTGGRGRGTAGESCRTPKYTIWRLMQLGTRRHLLVLDRSAAGRNTDRSGAIAGAVVFCLYALYQRVFVGAVPVGFTASLVVMTWLSGVQLLFLGVIGEYLGRVYTETKGRPTYIVADIVEGCDGRAVRRRVS